MAKGKTLKLFSVAVTEDLLSQIDEIRFREHFDNRNVTINYLIQLALQAIEENPELLEQADKRSNHYNKGDSK